MHETKNFDNPCPPSWSGRAGCPVISLRQQLDGTGKTAQADRSLSGSTGADGAKKRAALLEEADRYNQKLAELGISFDMLGEAEKEALLIDGKSYEELLLAEDSGVMGYLEIEKIKLKLPMYHGVSAEALQDGVGHL